MPTLLLYAHDSKLTDNLHSNIAGGEAHPNENLGGELGTRIHESLRNHVLIFPREWLVVFGKNI